jgi:hypothetical protein
MRNLNSFENSCKYLGIEPNLPDVSMLPTKHAKAIVSNYKLWVIAEAWNKQDGFVPDHGDARQPKYYPAFLYDKNKSAFALWFSHFDLSDARAGFGARLAFKTHSRADKFGEMFIGLHNDVLLIG